MLAAQLSVWPPSSVCFSGLFNSFMPPSCYVRLRILLCPCENWLAHGSVSQHCLKW